VRQAFGGHSQAHAQRPSHMPSMRLARTVGQLIGSADSTSLEEKKDRARSPVFEVFRRPRRTRAVEGVEGRVAAFNSCPSQPGAYDQVGSPMGIGPPACLPWAQRMAVRAENSQNFHWRALVTMKSRKTCTFFAVFNSSG
jgi:hypothetical protein